MQFRESPQEVSVSRFASAKIYFMQNHLHEKPFGLIIPGSKNDTDLALFEAAEICYKAISFDGREGRMGFAHGLVFRAGSEYAAPQRIEGVRFDLERKGMVLGRASVFFLEELALLEDVFVEEEYRSEGLGREIVTHVRDRALERAGSLTCTSRFSKDGLHRFYESLGLKKIGIEYRINYGS